MTKKPNILFLMTDEHRADVTGYEGNSIIKTPVLDKLASKGLVFSNAYTPSPICVPARQCLMAGQLPRHCGCEGWVDLKPGYMTFSRLLSMYAYETVACGKLHHVGTDQMQGWTQRIGNEMKVAPTYIKDKKPEEFQKYLRPFNDYKWSDTKEVKRAGIGKSRCQTVDEYTMIGALGFIDEYFNDAYYDRERKDQPLLLKVSLLEPHYPYCTDESKFKYYLNRVKPYFEESLFDHPFLSLRQVIPEKDASKREITRAVAAYYGMI